MILSVSATHALRAVAGLACSESGEAVLGRDVARRIGLPGHYLAKILATLARGGVLAATRGVNGGYRLARPASAIRLIEVVLPFEGKQTRPGCLLQPDRPCLESNACPAHCHWRGVSQAYEKFFEKTTVADIRGGAQGTLPGQPRRATPPGVGARRGSSHQPRRCALVERP